MQAALQCERNQPTNDIAWGVVPSAVEIQRRLGCSSLI
jgi:hypothetical protein